MHEGTCSTPWIRSSKVPLYCVPASSPATSRLISLLSASLPDPCRDVSLHWYCINSIHDKAMYHLHMFVADAGDFGVVHWLLRYNTWCCYCSSSIVASDTWFNQLQNTAGPLIIVEVYLLERCLDTQQSHLQHPAIRPNLCNGWRSCGIQEVCDGATNL